MASSPRLKSAGIAREVDGTGLYASLGYVGSPQTYRLRSGADALTFSGVKSATPPVGQYRTCKTPVGAPPPQQWRTPPASPRPPLRRPSRTRCPRAGPARVYKASTPEGFLTRQNHIVATPRGKRRRTRPDSRTARNGQETGGTRGPGGDARGSQKVSGPRVSAASVHVALVARRPGEGARVNKD
jgi:hypothetical protein